MGEGGIWSFLPEVEKRGYVGGFKFLDDPLVKLLCPGGRRVILAGGKGSQVVGKSTAANDKNPLVSQGEKGLAEGMKTAGIRPRKREPKNRNVSLRAKSEQWHPHSVIEAA